MLNIRKVILIIGALLPCTLSQLAGQTAAGNTNPVGGNTITPGGVAGAGAAGAGAGTGTCYTFKSDYCPDFGTISSSISQQEFEAKVQGFIDEARTSLLDSTNASCTLASLSTNIDSNVRYLKTYACGSALYNEKCQPNITICKSVCPIFASSIKSIPSCINMTIANGLQTRCETVTSADASCKDYSILESNTCGFSSAQLKETFCSTDSSKYPCCSNSPNAAQSSTTKTTEEEDDDDNKASEKKEGGSSFFKSKTFYIILGCAALAIGILLFFYYVGRGEEELEEKERQMNKNAGYGEMQENSHKINMDGTYGEKEEMNNPYRDVVNDNSPNMYGSAVPLGNNNNNDINNPFDDKNKSNIDNFGYNNEMKSPNPYGMENQSKQIQNEVSYQSPTLFASPNMMNNDNNNNSYSNVIQNPFDSPSMKNTTNNNNQQNGGYDDEPSMMMVNMIDIPKPKQNNTNLFDEKVNNENEELPKKAMVNLTEIPKPQQNSTNIVEDSTNQSMVDNKKSADDSSDEIPKKAMVNLIEITPPSSAEVGGITSPEVNGETNDATQDATQNDNNQTQDTSEIPEAKPYKAIHTYEPQINDELKLDIGDKIDVIYEYDDGWVWAINKTNGEQGACPMLCLASAKEEESGEREWEKQMDLMKVPGRRDSMLSLDLNRFSQLKTN